MQQRERNVVRALIVSPDNRVLLARIILEDRTFWITPGGGIQGDEDGHTALVRELAEETGRTDWEIGPAVWTRSHTFDFEGETLTQHERFHWVPSAEFVPPHEMPDAHENQYFGGFRWWSAREISASKEDFAPRQMARYFHEILDAGLPGTPIDVGV